MTDLPLACTLPADALIGRDEIAGGVRSRFRAAPGAQSAAS